jgi:hypothetical protein
MRFAEFPGAHTLNVSDDSIYVLLDEMIGELASVFSSPLFHMGADESWDVGRGATSGRVARTSIAAVHVEHYRRLFEIIRKHGKKPMIYGDVLLDHPEILSDIDQDVIIVDWHYRATEAYPSAATLSAAGFKTLASPAVWNFSGPFPHYTNSLANIRQFNLDGYRNGSLGLLTSTWNDYGGEALRELNYYGYAWTAECAWNASDADLEKFNLAFFTRFFGGDRAGLLGQTVYSILSDPLNQVSWHDLWRHPLLPPRDPMQGHILRLQSIESSVPLVNRILDELSAGTEGKKSHSMYLRYVADLVGWYGAKLRASIGLRRFLTDTTAVQGRDSTLADLLVQSRKALLTLTSLKDRFQHIWLATNRPENLEWLLRRFDRQAAYWHETIEALEAGTVPDQPEIPSRWIYHPRSNPRLRDSTATQIVRAHFRTSFPIDSLPASGLLQLIGDTHAKVWLNGYFLGEVYARRSLSLIVEHERIKLFDLAPYLRKGNNTLAVQVDNYDLFGSGGLNLYGEIIKGGGTRRFIVSDSTWRVADSVAAGWKQVDFDVSSWMSAAEKPYPFPVIRPNFAVRRSSWIER